MSADADYQLGTITIGLALEDDDVTVAIELPWGELSVLQMLGMLDLARDAILHPDEDAYDDEDNDE